MTNRKKVWIWNKYLAIILSALFILLSIFYIMPSIIAWSKENNEIQQSRTFHIVFEHYLDQQPINIENVSPAITIDMALTYPHGTLVVDDPVSISGVAIINESIAEQINFLTIWFQNAQAYPHQYDANKITQGQELYIDTPQYGNRSRLIGNTTVVWVNEGAYYPELALTFTNETGIYVAYIGKSTDAGVIVYPKEKLAQVVTNDVLLILAIVVYLLTVIGVGNLIFSLWERKPSSKGK